MTAFGFIAFVSKRAKIPVLVECTWGQWGNWSSCSKTCDGGEKVRTRLYTPPQVECDGLSKQTSPCNVFSCKGDFLLYFLLNLNISCIYNNLINISITQKNMFFFYYLLSVTQ